MSMYDSELGPKQLAWLEALESGQFQQRMGYLCQKNDDFVQHCCLGVLLETLGVEKTFDTVRSIFCYMRCAATLPKEVVEELGFFDETGSISEKNSRWNLARWNDAGWTFREIAGFIRKNPKLVFQFSA